MLNKETNRRLREIALARGPLLVATDLDGTLAPIVPDPSGARVPTTALAVLERLTPVAKVAVVTGRDLNTARLMVPCDGVAIVGSHGLEASFDSELLPPVNRLKLAPALEALEQRVISAEPGSFLHIERKAISTAFHFRSDPSLEPGIRAALDPLPEGLRLREGRMVVEVLPDAPGGKDMALTALAHHFRAKSLLVIGDDLTDVAMFRAAIDLRNEGATVLVAGVSGGEETPPEIEELADVMLGSTEQVLEALETVARALRA
jgi:trehalose 6-phosphate phosphatase